MNKKYTQKSSIRTCKKKNSRYKLLTYKHKQNPRLHHIAVTGSYLINSNYTMANKVADLRRLLYSNFLSNKHKITRCSSEI